MGNPWKEVVPSVLNSSSLLHLSGGRSIRIPDFWSFLWAFIQVSQDGGKLRYCDK